MNNSDKYWMKKALSLARKGWGSTSPNPMVGAVIVKNGKLIGKGYHKKAGELHAEPLAITDAGKNAKFATLYVTLEPCSTYGRTPPCTDAIMKAGISRVVIGSADPNPKHAGKGIKILEANGIRTLTGVLEKECMELNDAFFHWITTGRPFVLLKMAMTLDGKIATEKGSSKWISGTASRKRVHQLRQWTDAILIGAETARLDRPSLTVRELRSSKQPRRLIATSSLSEKKLQMLLPAGNKPEKISAKSSAEWNKIMKRLGSENVTSILVEGGGELASSLLRAGLVNKVEFHVAMKILGGRGSRPVIGGKNPSSLDDSIKLSDVSTWKSGEDLIISGKIQQRHKSCSQES